MTRSGTDPERGGIKDISSASSGTIPASFGIYGNRRQNRSSVKLEATITEAIEVVIEKLSISMKMRAMGRLYELAESPDFSREESSRIPAHPIGSSNGKNNWKSKIEGKI